MSTRARQLITVAILAALIGVTALIAASASWWQVVMIVVIIGTLGGAAAGLETREYTLRKRTFVRTVRPRR